MSEYITLLGAEQVQRAATTMQSAADDMLRASISISDSVGGMARLVERLEFAAERLADRLEQAAAPAVSPVEADEETHP